MPAETTGRRSVLFALIAVALSIVVALLGAEGVLRLYATINPVFGTALREADPMAVKIEPHGTWGYRQRPGTTIQYSNGTTATANRLGYRGPEVPPEPAPGTTRIILLGGSTTHGYGASTAGTIDAHMRRILQLKYPGRAFEVVNLAFDGYDTYQMLQRLESDGLRMHPSIVVLNEGINDVRNAWYANLKEADPRTLLWAQDLARLQEEKEHGVKLWTRMKHWSFLIRIPGYVRTQLERRRGMEEQSGQAAPSAKGPKTQTTASASTSSGGAPYPDAANFFELHMRKMVELSLAQHASVLLSTPPSALRGYPPDSTSLQSYWVKDAKTTQVYRDTLAGRLRKIAAEEQARHAPVLYVAPSGLVPSMFIDDCHLTSEGNLVVALAMVDAMQPFLTSSP